MAGARDVPSRRRACVNGRDPRGRRDQLALRWRDRDQRRVVRRRRRRAVRDHRPERRRQDVDLQHDQPGVPPAASATSAGSGESIMGLRPDRVAELGIARTFQNIELFPQMTVIDNLLTGRHVRMKRSIFVGRGVVRARQARGDREPPQGRRHHRLPRDRAVAQAPRGAAAVRVPEARRARTGAGDGAGAAAARRAGRRDEPRGDRGHGAVHPRHPARARDHDGARRARHGLGDGHRRPRAGARLRPADRARHARRGAVATRP